MQATLDDIRPSRRLEQPPRPRKRKRGVSLQTAAIVAILFAAGLVLLCGREAPPSQPETQVVAAPPPEWADIARPLALFDLSAPQFARLPQSYAARRNRLGGGRQDILTFGRLDGGDPFFRLTLYRVGSEAVPDVPLFVDLVRAGAAIDLAITRSANPAICRQGSGRLRRRTSTSQPEPRCRCRALAFAAPGSTAPSGSAASPAAPRPGPMSRPALACLIDRLEFDGGGGDPALVHYFAESDMNRSRACAGTTLAPDPATANWIDEDDAPPPLRLRKMRLNRHLVLCWALCHSPRGESPVKIARQGWPAKSGGCPPGRKESSFMRPISMFLLAVTAFGAGALASAPGALAAHKHHHAAVVYSSDQPPLTVNKRSWLDPGNVVPQGSEQNYVTATTGFNQTPDQAYFPSRFHEDSLPQPLYPTRRPKPLVDFWTPAYPPYQ